MYGTEQYISAFIFTIVPFLFTLYYLYDKWSTLKDSFKRLYAIMLFVPVVGPLAVLLLLTSEIGFAVRVTPHITSRTDMSRSDMSRSDMSRSSQTN
jgi:ABC-type sugar transport system permease subunit